MDTQTSFEQRLTDHLGVLVQDRAHRAVLRRCRPGTSGTTFEIYRLLGMFLPELDKPQRERCVLLAAYLAAAYPECWIDGDVSLGRGARSRAGEPDSENFGKRFTTLLDSSFEQLEGRLPQFMSLLQQKGRKISLARLIRDLLRWEYDQHPVQRRWARDYFAVARNIPEQERSSNDY